MKIALGADHAGFPLKERVKQWLIEQGVQVDDKGTFSNESVDYPDFARIVGEAVAAKQADRGILGEGPAPVPDAGAMMCRRRHLAEETADSRRAR